MEKETVKDENNLIEKQEKNAIAIKEKNEEETKQEVKEITESLEPKNEKKQIKTIENSKQIINNNNINKKNKIIIITLLILILILLITLLSTVFGILNRENKNILSGIFINGIDVSNINKNQAISKIQKETEKKLAQEIILKNGETQQTIILNQLGVKYKINEAVDEAYLIGRNNNLIISNYQILATLIKNNKINLEIEINDEKIDEIIKNINSQIPDSIKQYSYYIEDNNLVIIPGKSGATVDKEILKNKIKEFALDIKLEKTNIDLNIINKQPDKIDIEKIYSQIYKEASDAYITEKPFEIHSHVDGVDFAISKEEAKKIISEQKDEYKIPLKITKAQKTITDLGDAAFPDTLVTYTTDYATSNYNRKSNLELAAKKINGVIILPGETFSYNQVLGKRTVEAGFREAGAYAGGTVVTAIGGGICQVSSTLYNSVLLSDLEVIARSNHSLPTGYVPVGRDATVSWGGPEFKFKNNRKYPIKIVASTNGKKVTVSIQGVKQEQDYEIEIISYKVGTIGAKTEYVQDSSIPQGTQVVAQKGNSGFVSETYKIYKKDGVEVSRVFVSKDTYKAKKQIIKIGTGVVQQNTEQTQ